MKKLENKGITLIALVVTIIVLLILAAVSINLILGENGIVTRAKTSATNYSVAAAKEKIELEIADLYAANLNSETPVTFEMIANRLIEKGITAEGLTDEDNSTIITVEGYVATIVEEDNKWKVEMSEETVENDIVIRHKIDVDEGTITPSENIEITAIQIRDGIKKITLENGEEKTYNGEQVVKGEFEVKLNGTYTFIIEDTRGEKKTYSIEIRNIVEGTIAITTEADLSKWTNEAVEVEVKWPDTVAGVERQVSIDNGETYSEYTDKMQIGSNCIIKARIMYQGRIGVEAEPLEINNIDTQKPTIGNISVPSEIANTKTITISGIEDTGGSGLKGYYISQNSSEPTTNSAWIANTESSTAKSISENGTYYVWTIDNANNISDSKNIEVSNIVPKVVIEGFEYTTATINTGSLSENPSITKTGVEKTGPVYSITSGSNYATINSSTGVITGIAAGSVTVQVTYTNYDDSTSTKTTTLTINEPVYTLYVKCTGGYGTYGTYQVRAGTTLTHADYVPSGFNYQLNSSTGPTTMPASDATIYLNLGISSYNTSLHCISSVYDSTNTSSRTIYTFSNSSTINSLQYVSQTASGYSSSSYTNTSITLNKNSNSGFAIFWVEFANGFKTFMYLHMDHGDGNDQKGYTPSLVTQTVNNVQYTNIPQLYD